MRVVQASAVILVNAAHYVLIARRRPEQIYAGYWEFPGGKIEQDETSEQAAIREVKEEVGVDISALYCVDQLVEIRTPENDIPYKVVVDIWVSKQWNGEVCGVEGQEIGWVLVADLSTYNLLPANIPLIAKIQAYIM